MKHNAVQLMFPSIIVVVKNMQGVQVGANQYLAVFVAVNSDLWLSQLSHWQLPMPMASVKRFVLLAVQMTDV